MKIKLKSPIQKQYREVNIEIGMRVKVTEWDSIEVEGTVSEINFNYISLEKVIFLSGAYDCFDYSEYEKKDEFTFSLENVCSILVAEYDKYNPLTLINKALGENYCGSREIVVSPLFHEWYKEYVKDYSEFYKVYQYEIRVDSQLEGFHVHAVPNHETLKHRITPKQNYWIEFYKNGKWSASHLISVFPDEFESIVKMEKEKYIKKSGNNAFAYRVRHEEKIILRGSNNIEIEVSA